MNNAPGPIRDFIKTLQPTNPEQFAVKRDNGGFVQPGYGGLTAEEIEANRRLSQQAQDEFNSKPRVPRYLRPPNTGMRSGTRNAGLSSFNSLISQAGEITLGRQSQDALESGESSKVALGIAAAPLVAFEKGYHIYNTAGSTLMLLANAPAIAAGITDPGSNFVPGVGGSPFLGGFGNLGGEELNPELRDGFQWNDITATWKNAWDNDLTIGQTGMLSFGRTFNQPFWDEEGDEKIVQESIAKLGQDDNGRALYASNIGLSSRFDISDKKQIESATDQGWGRWISGTLDAATQWWLGWEVLGAKAIGAAVKKANTVVLTSQADAAAARKAYAAHKLFVETAGAQGQRTAIGDLATYVAKTPKKYLAQHEIAQQSTNPALVADVLGSVKTADDAFDAILALGGDQQAIKAIQDKVAAKTVTFNGKEMTAIDALTMGRNRRIEIAQEMEELRTKSSNMSGGLTPYFDNWMSRLKAQNDELQKVMDEARGELAEFDGIRRAVDLNTGITRGEARIAKLNVAKGGSEWGTNRVAKQANKAKKRYERITGENLWTSEAIQAGGKWGRTIRTFRAGADYMRTTKIRGMARVSDAKDSLIEMQSALTTNPLLRKLSRKNMSMQADGLIYDIEGEWMPTARRKIEAKRDTMSDEAWDEYKASGEFDAWVQENKLMTATQFREKYYYRMLQDPDEISRFKAFDDFEEEMFVEMALEYGMDQREALAVLEVYQKMRNQVAAQIKERGWYWDKPSNELHNLPDLQSELAEAKPLLDFQFMDRMFRINAGGFRGARTSLGVSMSSVLSAVDAVWRPLVLMRLGYTLRNVAESNIRELAYTSQITGASNFSGVAKAKDFKWIDTLTNAGDRLGQVKNFAVHGPLRYGTKGTLRALRKSLDDEAKVLRNRRNAAENLRAEVRAAKRERDLMIKKAKRIAAIKKAREISKRKSPGESVVWEQIETEITRRREFYTSVDEIILDPQYADGLGDGFATGIFARDADAFAARQAEFTGQVDAMGGSIQNWLNDADRLELQNSMLPNGLYDPAVSTRVAFRALDRWAQATGGDQGMPVRVIDAKNGHFEVLHDVNRWYEDSIAKGENPQDLYDSVRVVSKFDKIEGARTQVAGGVLDLRPGGFGDQWNRVELDPSVWWVDTWTRLFKYGEASRNLPQYQYPKLARITDPVGGSGKYEDAIGYVPANMLAGFLKRSQLEDETFEWSAEAAGEMTTPIVLYGYGDPSRMVVEVADGAKRIRAAQEAIRRGEEPTDLPVVIEWQGDYFPAGTNVDNKLALSSDRKLAYMNNMEVNAVTEFQNAGGRFVNPNLYRQLDTTNDTAARDLRNRLDEMESWDDPAWQDLRSWLEKSYTGGDRDATVMLDVARIMRAAEIDPIARKQVQIRLADITDPGFTAWLKQQGHIMDDIEFRQMIDDLVPWNSEETMEVYQGAIRSLIQYQGDSYDQLNKFLWNGEPFGEQMAGLIRNLDWITTRTHMVTGDTPMRVWRASDHEMREGKIPAYLSTSEIPGGVDVTSGDFRMAYDVEPGVPYASFMRLLGKDNWEAEIVLPRGVKSEYIGVVDSGDAYGQVPLYRITWDEADNADPVAIGHGWRANDPGFHNGLPQKLTPTEKVSGQLGGYTYGNVSGVWRMSDGQTYYVKDYPNEPQSFLEHFIDNHYVNSFRTRSTQMVYFPDEGRWVYASVMEPDGDYTQIGKWLDENELSEEQAASLKAQIVANMAEDTILMNFDAVGPAGENLWVKPNVFGGINLAKLDNGASGPYRAHGELASWKTPSTDFESIILYRDENGYAQIIDAIDRAFPDNPLQPALKTALAEKLLHRIGLDLDQYGPVGDRMMRYYANWRRSTDKPVEFFDDLQDLANMLNERQKDLLYQIRAYQESIFRDTTEVNQLIDKFEARVGRTKTEADTYIESPAPLMGDESRPAAAIVHAIDKPGEIAEDSIVTQLAQQYALENGYGKVITPNPSNGRGYQIQVNPDQVYNGGDNLDNTYPGWLEGALQDQATVLDMTRATPQQLFQSIGTDLNTSAKILGGVDSIPAEAKARLAIRMENEGYTHVALPNGKKLSQSELIGTSDAGAAYGAALATDEVEAAAQVMLAKSEKYNEVSLKIEEKESALRSAESRLAEREAATEKARQRLDKRLTKRKKASDPVWTGGQLNEKLKYTVRTEDGYQQSETEIPSAFGDQASLYKQLTSSNDRVAADMMGLGELTYKGMRTTRREAVLQPYSDQYWRALAEYGEKRFSNDIVGQAILEGKTDDEIMDLMFGTARGQSAIRKMDDFKAFRDYVSRETLGDGLREDMVALIAERRQVLDTYFPDERIRAILADPKKTLNADTLRLNLGPRHDLKPFQGTVGEVERGMYRRTVGSIMHVIGTLPEDKLARHPFFRNRYRESMQQQVQGYADQGVESFTQDQLEQMARIARDEALQTLQDTLYTITRVSTFADAMRLILPFFPAFWSSARFWMYQIPKSRPENLVRYAMVDSAPDRAGWTVDENNDRVQGAPNAAVALTRKLGSTQQRSIAFQVAEDDLGWFEKYIGPQSLVQFPLGSIDMMLQGEFPLIPSTAPLVTTPVAFVAAARPDITSMITEAGDFSFTLGGTEETMILDGTLGEVLADKVMPFGRPEQDKDFIDSAIDSYAPAWLNKLIIAARGESSSQLQSLAAEIHRSRMTDWDLNDRIGESPKYRDSVKEAQEFQVFRMLVNVSAPFSPSFRSKYQFYIDSWRDIQSQGYAEGWSLDEMEAVFIQRYGKEFFRYTRSKSGNQSGMAADLGEYEAVTRYEELTGTLAAIGGDAKYINMLTKTFNTGDGWNPAVYAWQMDRPIPGAGGRTYRGGPSQSLLEVDSQKELGWKYYNQQVTRLEAIAESKGYSQDAVTASKKKLVASMAQKEEYQDWYAEFQEISGGRWVNSVNALYAMMNDEKLMADFGPPEDTPYEEMNKQQQYFWAITEFIKIRNWGIEKLEEAKARGGSDNIDAKQNAALAKVIDQRIKDLGDINEDFRYMHRRYFGGDKLIRTQDVAEARYGG